MNKNSSTANELTIFNVDIIQSLVVNFIIKTDQLNKSR